MTPQPTPNEDEHEDLIAYLDGELDGDAARAVEARLNADDSARAEAGQLKQTWDLLDYLPRPEASPNFTNRTLDRISALRPASAGARAGRWRPALLGVSWAAVFLLAATAGFAGVAYFCTDRTDEELARDLRVIENKRYYDLANDLDFLKELDHPDLFGDDNTGS